MDKRLWLIMLILGISLLTGACSSKALEEPSEIMPIETNSTLRERPSPTPQAPKNKESVTVMPPVGYDPTTNANQEGFPIEAAVPPGTEEIAWEKAKTLILTGEVEQVFQTHSLQVTLYLKNGEHLLTQEPEIDAVFDVIEQCGEQCANMVMATE
ncbi:MAG: hypothetical protein JW981_00140 [Anaerolineae bacterium]|nr:hypothetical protein [Anaerolineae bacterium]